MLRSITKDKVQRQGKHSFPNCAFVMICIPYERVDLQLSNTGTNVMIAQGDFQVYMLITISTLPTVKDGPIYAPLTGHLLSCAAAANSFYLDSKSCSPPSKPDPPGPVSNDDSAIDNTGVSGCYLTPRRPVPTSTLAPSPSLSAPLVALLV